MDWYYALDGRQAGPVSEPELGQLLRNGVIDSATLVWHAGMKDWLSYSAAIGMPAVPDYPRYAGMAESPLSTSMAQPRVRYAGFWIRWVAYLIDAVVIGAIRSIILLPLGFSLMDRGAFRSPWFFTHVGEAQFSSFAISLCYFVFFWTQYGATPGKMVLRLKVISVQGGPLSLGQAVGRYFGQILSGILLCIGFMMAGWDDQKRALHDRLVETRVIRLD